MDIIIKDLVIGIIVNYPCSQNQTTLKVNK